jgi:hypothetical protein
MENNILIKFENFLKFLYLRPNKYNIHLSKYYINNINCTKDAVQLLRYLYINGYNNCDKIMERLCYLFSLSLPSYNYLAKLSLLHQTVLDTNNEEEYAILTVWSCANQAIIENEREKKVFVKVKFIILNNVNIVVELYY